MPLKSIAPVKVNLCLHIGPLRSDGLHELASLAIFPEYGDVITVASANDFSLDVTGQFAAQLSDVPMGNNLVIKAARKLRSEADFPGGAAITLQKNVPATSGIGGGTSDATTALLLLRELWQLDITDEALLELAFSIGADGPVCLMAHLSETGTAVMTGAGEGVAPGPALPAMWMCLVNPLTEVPTGLVFKAFDKAFTAPENPALPRYKGMREFNQNTRNDLQPFAEEICPEIASVLTLLASDQACIMTRMSGSGATCFGLYETEDAAMAAQAKAVANSWWAKAMRV